MIRITLEDRSAEGKSSGYRPAFCCDRCKKRISDPHLALYKWQNDDAKMPIADTLVVLHKGECDALHNTAYRAKGWPWNEFTELLGLLVNNVNRDDAEHSLWAYLIQTYCPGSDLEEVAERAQHLIEHPERRPPTLNDLSY